MAVTDADQLTEIQLTLQEDATFSNGLWSSDEVIGYFNQRQYRFLFDTKLLVSVAILPWTPGEAQHDYPQDWITTISALWHDFATSVATPLPESDVFELDWQTGPLGAVTPGIPQGFRDADTSDTLTVTVGPVPSAPGGMEIVYVGLSEVLDGTGQLFDIPDDWVPFIKYGVLADMLGKTGRGQDLLRARYAEQRFQEGVMLAQSLLQGWP